MSVFLKEKKCHPRNVDRVITLIQKSLHLEAQEYLWPKDSIGFFDDSSIES